ncbi:hypothetical protein P43SY_000824 [Pythium insidiosum]|uniref:Uncharacterized protein n=1 Tax=Pythium insidiosum TaxID=114742 RepID=A0AAD5LYW1_PYTIN|nr:hypothetical protein P43SY_000824 [Pythium insidiosum]
MDTASADDLYAGLPVPSSKPRGDAKRKAPAAERGSDEKVDADCSGGAPPPPEKRAKAAQKELSLEDALTRLQTHIMVDKKFAKAASLLSKLVDEKLSSSTADSFMRMLTECIEQKQAAWSGKPEFAALVRCVLAKRSELPATYDQALEDWRLWAVTHQELFTDDTFEFARAAKLVRARLETVLSSTAQDGDKRDVAQLRRLMPLLRTLFKRHTTAWAKTVVETVLGICTRHRLVFDDEDRAEVDQWTKAIQDRRHAPSVAHSAASDARRNVVVVDGGAMSEAKPKVGRSNHPLFNIH